MFKIRVLTVTLLLTLGGCQSIGQQVYGAKKSNCSVIKRDLTVAWDKRTYWCVPKQ